MKKVKSAKSKEITLLRRRLTGLYKVLLRALQQKDALADRLIELEHEFDKLKLQKGAHLGQALKLGRKLYGSGK